VTSDSASSNQTQRAQPESFRAGALTASLTVKDLRASVAWYRDVMGFTVDREYERDGKLRSVAIVAGVVRLLLNQDDGAKGWDRAIGTGFSLQFITKQNIDELANRIKAAGGSLESEPADMPWGVRMFRLRDPDGFRFAVSSERP
jgi:lactoylglutathione lyase